jgi:hypothetical protein
MRYQAPREPYDVTSAQLSIVVVQRGKICWRFGSRNWLFRRKYEKSKHKKLNFLLFNSMLKYVIYRLMHDFFHIRTVIIPKDRYRPEGFIWKRACINLYSNMTSFKRFESKPVVKIIYTCTHCNLWRHRQFITIFYQFLHIKIEIIHGSHMYTLFLPRVGLCVSFLCRRSARKDLLAFRKQNRQPISITHIHKFGVCVGS